jgi:hypothetical protein
MPAIVVQVSLVLLVLSASSQQTDRYLLPLAPYLALAVGWVGLQIRGRSGRLALAGLLALQLVWAQVWQVGATRPARDLSSASAQPIEAARAREVLGAINHVASGNRAGPLFLATGLLDLFNVQLEYEAAKQRPYLEKGFSGGARKYDSVEFMLAGSSSGAQWGHGLKEIWSHVEAKAAFVVVVPRHAREVLLERRTSRAGPGDAGWLQLLQDGSDLAGLVEASAVFEPIDLPDYPEIAIFARAGAEHVR